MIIKFKFLISTLFALLASWIIFAAIPFFQLKGLFPQVDSQIIFLHGLCGLMSIYLAINILFNKFELKNIDHPLILIPFFLAMLGIISSIFSQNFNFSLYGAPQIGQGVFWYFDLTLMSIVFSQVVYKKQIRFLLFANLICITFIVTIFTFFPFWKKIPMSFYYFTDYLCFYGVLCFILFTTINKNIYLNILFFIFLGIYFSFLENRAAVLFWITTAIAGLGFWGLKLIIPYIDTRRFKDIFYSNYMFVLIIILISLLTLISSIYFWSNEYNLSLNIKDTILDAPVVRGKIMETSLYGLNDLKSFLFGVGWGMVPDLLLENMNSWQYDELRLGYNLHFHTHNDLAEHLISLGIVGGVLFVLYIYFIFKESDKFSFASKLGWLLFFKINCFWFLWTGTLPLFAIVVSCFIFTDIKKNKLRTFFLKVSQVKRVSFSLLFFSIGALLFFGAIFSFSSTKVHSMLRYDRIIEHIKSKNDVNKKSKCLGFYSDFDRGGFLLERFLGRYADYIFSLNIKDVDADAFSVLYELQCKANSIIEKNNYTFALLNTAMQIDSNFYYKFGDTEEGREYLRKNYNKWFAKASIMSEKMPNRGDLILPFLSYASNNAKNEDALKVCMNKVKGIEAFCDLILAKKILDQEDINQELILQSIGLIKKAINKGIFNELIYGYWYNRHEEFDFFGLRGIPLSPDIIFLISDKEKFKLEETIKNIE